MYGCRAWRPFVKNYLYPCSIVPIRIALMNQIVHLNTVNRIVRAWTITSISISLFTRFSKTGIRQKIIKDNIRFDLYCPFTKFSSIFKRYYGLTHMSSQGFFVNFYQKLVFYFCFKHHLKNLNQGKYGLTHTVLLEKFNQLL